MKYLGIDWGEKRIGLALGDSETRLASPYKVVGRLDEIKKAAAEEEIDALVVGVPAKMNGLEKNLSGEFTAFLDLLKKEIKLPVHAVDERLTSKAADALEGGKKLKAPRDAIAAMLILQSYLDKTTPHKLYGSNL